MHTYLDDYQSLTELNYWPTVEDESSYGSTTYCHTYIDTKLAHSIVEDLRVMFPKLSEWIDSERHSLFNMELSEVRDLLKEKDCE